MSERYKYRVEDVTASGSIPNLVANTYKEQSGLLHYMVENKIQGASAAEVGCGYARMTPVLTEVFDLVFGFEREPHFREMARQNWPEIGFPSFDDLWSLPGDNEAFDFVLTWTCLQHVHDCHIGKVCDEISRIVKIGGKMITCEETERGKDGSSDLMKHICNSRQPHEYGQLFHRFKYIGCRQRPYDGGHMMLWEKVR